MAVLSMKVLGDLGFSLERVNQVLPIQTSHHTSVEETLLNWVH